MHQDSLPKRPPPADAGLIQQVVSSPFQMRSSSTGTVELEGSQGSQRVAVQPGVQFPSLDPSLTHQDKPLPNANQSPASPFLRSNSYPPPGGLNLEADTTDPPMVNLYSPPLDPTFDPVARPPTPPSTTTTSDNLSTASHTTASTSKTSGLPASSGTMICMDCNLPMSGQFVKALDGIHHLECFRCRDCNKIVAEKFFPIEGPDGKQHPLCETDYFRRLDLICHNCKAALRGSYITACNKKFHVEHFTCSVCPTVFGQQDSYYEHENEVYCHFHYSTRFATKCTGCNSAILKQFVEINRNMKDECWHPECYMIHKFWNVKVSTRRPISTLTEQIDSPRKSYIEEESNETAMTLKEKQAKMEQQVYRVWTVLSAFEESSAACISDMLRAVSGGQYLEAIRMAERFILHVEVLFAVIDDLEGQFATRNAKGISHVREARMLCRKTVDLFTLLSRTHQESEQRRTGMTQDLLALVTGIAHYLKILIRIALTGGLKLEREHSTREPINAMLDKLHLLAVRGGNPTAKRLIKSNEHPIITNGSPSQFLITSSTQGVSYGYKSLAPEMAGESPFWGRDPNASTSTVHKVPNPPSDLCISDNTTVEEDCVRLGTYQRWHSSCVRCKVCGKMAGPPSAKPSSSDKEKEDDKDKDSTPKLSTARRAPANVAGFVFEEIPGEKKSTFNIYCLEHQRGGCRTGFQAVSRLEQYAYLLNVALRRLYVLLKQRGVIQLTPELPTHRPTPSNPQDLLTVKSVHLDRKLSATGRIPQRSTVVESPSGKSVQPASMPPYITRVSENNVPQRAEPQSARPSRPPLNPSAATSPNLRPTIHPPPSLRPSEPMRSSPTSTSGDTLLRFDFERNNPRIKIVDEPIGVPDLRSPAESRLSDDVLTLADIPQLVEAGQALEQRRSIPHQLERPLVSDLSPLELIIIKYFALLVLYRSPLREQFDLDEILELIEMKKGGFWKQLFKGSSEKSKNMKKKGVFGIPLEILVERDGFDSTLGLSRQPLRVPSFIDDVVSAMRQMDMSVEGIFRKNGNIRRLKDLSDAIDHDPSGVDLTTDNPVQLAALLKKFLRDLPDPLFTFKLHRLFISTLSINDRGEAKRLRHMLAILLPKSHFDTMQVLFVFLKWVASFAHIDEKGNKMDLENLATVLAPNILYAKGKDPAREETFTSIRVVSDLLEMQEELFMVPQEFMEVLHDQEYFAGAFEMPSKDLLKKCDTYMRVRSSNRAPSGLMSPVLNGIHTPFPPAPPFAIPPSNSGSSTPQDEDIRLVPQRSDPVLTRGRTVASEGHHGRYSPPRRMQWRNSRSLERGAASPPPGGVAFPTGRASKTSGPHPLGQPSSSSSYDLANSPPPRIQDPDRPSSRREGSPGSGSERGFQSQSSYSPIERSGVFPR